MNKKLFCELCPLTYKISVNKERFKRYIKWLTTSNSYATHFQEEKLPVLIYSHNSLIRRKLGNINLELQENKATNLNIAAPKINKILIKPGEIFSFWKLVGKYSKSKGYKDGLTIENGKATSGIGGGMCQFTNLLHWMILHSSLDIVEHHHHHEWDLFPDFNRAIPFGTGTSIVYNYLDYQFKNNTTNTYQLIVYTTDTHLCGELRSLIPEKYSYHIKEKDLYFYKKNDKYYRHNKIFKKVIDKGTGNTLSETLLIENNALVMYSEEYIDESLLI